MRYLVYKPKFIKPKPYIWLSLKSDICQFCQNRASYTYYSQLEMSIRFFSIFKNESKTETEKFWAISKMVIIEILVNFEHIPGRNTPMNQFETIFMGSKDMSDF